MRGGMKENGFEWEKDTLYRANSKRILEKEEEEESREKCDPA